MEGGPWGVLSWYGGVVQGGGTGVWYGGVVRVQGGGTGGWYRGMVQGGWYEYKTWYTMVHHM